MKNQKEIKELIPFTTATQRIKYLGINLPKETCRGKRYSVLFIVIVYHSGLII